jgi:6-phosphogluconolactonase (cycloisomerase 2 family)
MLKIFPLIPLFLLLNFSGCGQFFPPQTTTSGGGTGTGTGTGNYFYVANATTQAVAGFQIGTTNLTNTSNSPYSVGVAPSAMAATPNGSFVYVATLAGAIYGYSVGTGGALTLLNGGNALITGVSPTTIRVDPSGNWLIAADLTPAAYVFAINSTSGLLTQQGGALPLDAGSPNHIAVTPSNGLVYISLGTGGVDICAFSPSSGALSKLNQILKPTDTDDADNGLAIDPASKYLFVAETGINALRVLTIASTGSLAEVKGSPFTTGLGPTGVTVDASGSYVYVTNQTDGTVSAFSLASATGALTDISGSPFSTGLAPADLAEDTSKTYIGVACSGGTPDFQVFTIGSSTSTTPGGLTSFAKTTGNTASGALAVVAAD